MKVLLLATGVFKKGGIERYTRYQYQALQEILGADNVVLASLLGEEKENSFEEAIEVEYVQGGISLTDKLTFVRRTLGMVRRHKIDVLISNHRQLSIIGQLARFLYGTRYCTNVYGLEIWSGMNAVEKSALLKSDRLIGDCNFILEYIRSNFSYPSNQMDLLYDPVDTGRFAVAGKDESLYGKYGIPKDKFIVATVGRLERNKGHEIMIRTLPALDKNIIYLVVGGGSQKEEMEKLAEELGLGERVIFTGRVPEDDLVGSYNLAELIVLLSVFDKDEGEGLPLGLIEASGCGKAIICGNEDGSQDAISTKYPNGFLIDPRSQTALAGAINTYYNDRGLLKEHGDNGRKFITEEFAFDKFKERQAGILKSLESGGH